MTIRLDPEGRERAALAASIGSFAGKRVLEIGCGDGRLTRTYAGEAAAVVAIDPDQSAIREFRADMPAGGIDARAFALEHFVAPDHSFDVAIFSWSL